MPVSPMQPKKNGQIKDSYFLKRDMQESDMLNQQHQMFLNLINHEIIHKSIPKENLHAIADIATGTGIWLQEIQSLYAGCRQSPYLHGFDISDKQFPSKSTIQFSQQSMLDEFPKEHQGRYDLVHVRFVLAGLKEVDYPRAIMNVMSLIKPGGYLQWEDDDFTKSYQAVRAMHLDLHKMMDDFVDYFRSHHFCLNVPVLVQDICQRMGLELIGNETYNTADVPADQVDSVRFWFPRMLATVMSAVYGESTGTTESESQLAMSEMIEKIEAFIQEGPLPDEVFGMVVFQKK